MTREEALKVLDTIPTIGEQVDALEMAIKALEQQPTDDATLKDIFCMGCEYKEQKPCEDCISRQAVTDMLTQEWTKYIPMELDINLSFVLEKINELPSVTPQRDNSVLDCVEMREPTAQERESIKRYINSISVTVPLPKIGRWMDGTCSECGKTCLCDGWGIDIESKYCPSCGCRMEVSE